jgi:steroid delta-isomerase-like uncharacterized protein
MSTVSNKELLRSYLDEAYSKGNTAAVDQYVAPDFVNHNPVLGPQEQGAEGEKQRVRLFRSAFPDLHGDFGDLISEGDKVAGRITNTGTQLGDLMGLAPTGKRVSWQTIGIWRIANGKIAERWIQHDFLGLLQQLGAIPEEMALIVSG